MTNEYPAPTPRSWPSHIAVGPDGNLWFTENRGNNVARMTLDGSVTEFPLPTPAAGPAEIVPAADGSLWFTEFNVSQLGQITLEGVVTEFPIPTARGKPQGMAARSGGRTLWFCEVGGRQLGTVRP